MRVERPFTLSAMADEKFWPRLDRRYVVPPSTDSRAIEVTFRSYPSSSPAWILELWGRRYCGWRASTRGRFERLHRGASIANHSYAFNASITVWDMRSISSCQDLHGFVGSLIDFHGPGAAYVEWFQRVSSFHLLRSDV